MRQLVRAIPLSRLSVGLVGMELVNHSNCHIYALLPPDDGQLASAKHVEV
jgi:hypothetical protein